MFKNKFVFIAIATCLFIIVSCKPVELPFNCDIPKVEDIKKSDNLNIAIYFDGTPSMEGYVATNSESNYMKTIDSVNSVVSTINLRSNKVDIKYYRLGPDVKEQNRSEYVKAKLPEFYNGKLPNFPLLKVSQIEKAIIPPEENKDKLTVIFTDLYQKDADINNISLAIKNNYQKRKGYAIGILAVKSEFNGTIYDIGANSKSLKYQGLHPFYVMFIGQYSDIKTVFDNLKDKINDSEKVIFYRDNIVTQISSLPEVTPISEENKEVIESPDSLKLDKFTVEKNKNINLLEIDKNATKTATLTYNESFYPTSYTLEPNFNSMDVITKVQSINTIEEKFIDSPDAKLKDALQVNKFQINKDKLNFNVTIDPTKFDNPGIYTFTIDANVKDLQDQKWWKDWNTDKYDDGSRTNNLSKFFTELKLITQNDKLMVGRFCYAIQKN